MFLPFQILGGFFRALLTLAILGGAVYLLVEWNNHRHTPVIVAVEDGREPRGVDQPGEGVPARTEVEMVPWHFGLNVPTALLLGGLALLAWSLVGWAFPALLFRRGGAGAEVRERTPGSVRRLPMPDGAEIHVEIHG